MSAGEEAAPAQPQKPDEQQQPPEEEQVAEQKKEDAPAAEAQEETKPAEEAAAPAEPQQPEVTYKSLVLSAHGGYDKVKLQTKKGQPKPKAGELLIRVRACGLNFSDLLARQGVCDRLPSMPVSLGMECAGIVEELGEGVADRQVSYVIRCLISISLWHMLMSLAY